jgi:tRNA A-37 threonylcarbamoyl transferase component Bud32
VVHQIAESDSQNDGTVTLKFPLVNDQRKRVFTFLSCALLVIMLFVIACRVVQTPQLLSDNGFLTLTLSMLVSTIFALSLNWFFFYRRRNGTIYLSKEGVEFSGFDKLSLLSRVKRDWSDLHSVQIIYLESSGKDIAPQFKGQVQTLWQMLTNFSQGPCVNFDFKSGGSSAISLAWLTRPQAEALFSAIEQYAEPSKFSTDFVKMQKAIILERLDEQSFTQLWSESLSPRYCATNYVPLPTNHELQNGRYSILMELAAGGMSAVYLAKANGFKVILKESVLPDISMQQQEKARELFEREANLLLKLKHPQIAKVLDRFVEASRDYLVLEYVPGLTLGQLVKAKGKQKEKDVRNWCRQLVEILIHLHGQDPPLLHRDLTPDNIVLRADNSVFLIDFGAANEFVGQATGTMIGKQCYISPEQLRGKATQSSDLYALGATLHYLLTGDDPEPLSVSRPIDKSPRVSQSFSDLVTSLTAFEAQERPKSANEVLKIVDGWGITSSIARSGKN